MWYIKPIADASGNHGNPHYPAREGDLELPEILTEAYVDARGFVLLTVENGIVMAVEKNEDAYNAYITEHPDTPTPPTDLERIEAQVLYTALMTDTLREEE